MWALLGGLALTHISDPASKFFEEQSTIWRASTDDNMVTAERGFSCPYLGYYAAIEGGIMGPGIASLLVPLGPCHS